MLVIQEGDATRRSSLIPARVSKTHTTQVQRVRLQHSALISPDSYVLVLYVLNLNSDPDSSLLVLGLTVKKSEGFILWTNFQIFARFTKASSSQVFLVNCEIKSSQIKAGLHEIIIYLLCTIMKPDYCLEKKFTSKLLMLTVKVLHLASYFI